MRKGEQHGNLLYCRSNAGEGRDSVPALRASRTGDHREAPRGIPDPQPRHQTRHRNDQARTPHPGEISR